MSVPRTNGMIWIDKEAPYRLKYHVSDEDYTVDVSPTYTYTLPAGEKLYAGTVVKLLEIDKIGKAIFPDDLANVLGVVLQTVENTGETSASFPVSVGRAGSIIIDLATINEICPDIRNANIWGDKPWGNYETVEEARRKLLGAPIYWDMGHTVYNSQEGKVYYCPPEKGMCTLWVPTGFRYGTGSLREGEPNSFNVGFNNLPQVGTITNLKNISITDLTVGEIEVQLNFSNFDTTLEWHWPYFPIFENDVDVAGRLIGDSTDKQQDFYHGLFASSNVDIKSTARTFCKTSGYLYSDARGTELGSEYVINTSFDNVYGDNDRRSIMNYNCPYTMFYQVSGEVLYNIDHV